VRRADSEGTRRSPSWGKDSFLPPNKSRPELLRATQECEEQAAQTNLGARSHSGNSPEADAEEWIAFANGRQLQSGENSQETIGVFGTAH
jgi:hypothetical protein